MKRRARPARIGAKGPAVAALSRRLPFFYGWVVVAAAFVTMAVGVNARTAFSRLFLPIVDGFGWSREGD